MHVANLYALLSCVFGISRDAVSFRSLVCAFPRTRVAQASHCSILVSSRVRTDMHAFPNTTRAHACMRACACERARARMSAVLCGRVCMDMEFND